MEANEYSSSLSPDKQQALLEQNAKFYQDPSHPDRKYLPKDGIRYEQIPGWNQLTGFNQWLQQVSEIHDAGKPHNLAWREGGNLPWFRAWHLYFQSGLTPQQAFDKAIIDDEQNVKTLAELEKQGEEKEEL